MSDELPDTALDLERDAMYRAFEEAPGDLAGYGAMADRLDELGYPALAHAYRWMQRRGKWPHKRTHYADPSGRPCRRVPGRFRWAWYEGADAPRGAVGGVFPAAPRATHALSPLLLPGRQKVYASHQAAVMDLAKWLRELKDVYDLDEPKKAGL